MVKVWSASLKEEPSAKATTPRMWYRVLCFMPATKRLTEPPAAGAGWVQVVRP